MILYFNWAPIMNETPARSFEAATADQLDSAHYQQLVSSSSACPAPCTGSSYREEF